tara:strand:- start:14710 stop:15024 length:315 start_codon:yes stop_codon:yes gene_type:complete
MTELTITLPKAFDDAEKALKVTITPTIAFGLYDDATRIIDELDKAIYTIDGLTTYGMVDSAMAEKMVEVIEDKRIEMSMHKSLIKRFLETNVFGKNDLNDSHRE